MERRNFLVAASGAVGLVAVAPSPVLANHRRRRKFSLEGGPERFTELEQDGNNGGQYPPGVADGPVSFVRLPEGGWQGGQLAVFQMHASGHSYRHHTTDGTLGTLSPGNWCYGPQGNADDNRYAGITSVVQAEGGNLYGFIHQENFDSVGSIGLAVSSDTGYSWSYQGTIIRGVDLLPEGFRGSMLPSVVYNNGQFVMLFENRFGNGRHTEVHSAVANPDDPSSWDLQGRAFSNQGDPHYRSDSPRLVWSTRHREWICFYATDKAWRYRTSSNLTSWSSAQNIRSWKQRWTDPGGVHTWYQSPLDDSQDSSAVFGRGGIMVEHRIDLSNTQRRWPQYTTLTS